MLRVIKWAAVALGVVLLVVGGIYLPGIRALASTGAGFVAKQMCSCIFVSERSFDSCRPDMMESMDRIRAESVSGAGGTGVRAWVPGLFVERFASFESDYGCTLD